MSTVLLSIKAIPISGSPLPPAVGSNIGAKTGAGSVGGLEHLRWGCGSFEEGCCAGTDLSLEGECLAVVVVGPSTLGLRVRYTLLGAPGAFIASAGRVWALRQPLHTKEIAGGVGVGRDVGESGMGR